MHYRKLLSTVLLFFTLTASAQPKPAGQVEVFCGAELYYADVNFLRLYDLLIYLTPGAKWHMGNDWQLAVQAKLPVINNGYMNHLPGYSRYEMVRLGNLTLSKELHFNAARQHFKLTAGLFGRERWGGDLRWYMPLNSWLMLRAQGGLTRHWGLGFDLHSHTESDFDGPWTASAILGADIYLKPWNTEFRLSGGRYINEDYGLQLDVMRHFRHCTVLAFAQLHERGTGYASHNTGGGFKVIMMLPPYKKYDKEKVALRPATNFRLTYNAQSDGYSMKMYTTDPEENERELPVNVEWGTAVADGLNER
jgi:hypothetical protein